MKDYVEIPTGEEEREIREAGEGRGGQAMISIDFEPYCEGCEDMVPEVNNLFENEKVIMQKIYCMYNGMCKRLVERVEEKP